MDLNSYTGTESDIIRIIREAVKAKGAEALKGHKIAVENYLLAGEIGQEEWSEVPTLAIESRATRGFIFPQIMGAKVTGRTLWADDRVAGINDHKALKVSLEISMDEGETVTQVSGWLW